MGLEHRLELNHPLCILWRRVWDAAYSWPFTNVSYCLLLVVLIVCMRTIESSLYFSSSRFSSSLRHRRSSSELLDSNIMRTAFNEPDFGSTLGETRMDNHIFTGNMGCWEGYAPWTASSAPVAGVRCVSRAFFLSFVSTAHSLLLL
jgi:hypothetical protein